MKFTYAYLSYKNDIFDKYLLNSIKHIEKSIDIITDKDIKPAIFYNKVLKETKYRYIIFSHEDVSFSCDLINKICFAIEQKNNFGVLCAIGRSITNGHVKSNLEKMNEVVFCDSCFFVIDSYNNIFFDEKTFDDFHFFAEDYCLQCKNNLNKLTYTLPMSWQWSSKITKENYFIHHSYTSRSSGYLWGNYRKYRKLFVEKWPNNHVFKK